MEPSTEKAKLLEAARRGDSKAVCQLLIDCQTDLRRYAQRSCASQDVDDAVQDALMILFRRIGTLRVLSAFSGWLFQIVRHGCLRMLKQRAQRKETPLEDDSLSMKTDLAVQLDLASSIQELPPIYRDVVLHRDVTGYSAEETAQLLDVSVDAVKSRLHRARHLLRAKLK